MNTLLRMGVGGRFGHIWITRLDVCRPRPEKQLDVMTTPDQQFTKSIKSRMIVEKVVEAVRASAVFSFDYVFLLIVASTIAMLGLVYNNMVAIVASMVRFFLRIGTNRNGTVKGRGFNHVSSWYSIYYFYFSDIPIPTFIFTY